MIPTKRFGANVNSKKKTIFKQKYKKVHLALCPFRGVSKLETRKKPKKRTIKKSTYTVRRKNHKKLQFRRQFNLPGGSSPVLVSSSDVRRGVNFTFKGKSYKLTLRQMMKWLQKRNLFFKGGLKGESKGGLNGVGNGVGVGIGVG